MTVSFIVITYLTGILVKYPDRQVHSSLKLEQHFNDDYRRLYLMDTVDCHGALTNNSDSVRDAVAKSSLPSWQGFRIHDNDILHQTNSCTDFIRDRSYFMSSLSKLEADFPIAYSIMVFKDVEMVERLLRSVYRPQNYYCIHVDAKLNKDSTFYRAVAAITSCFGNVFLTKESVDVKWGEASVLTPELFCMFDLWKFSWKYFINLTGQEFPLKTNRELVEILMAMKGANDVEGNHNINLERWKWKGDPPHGILPTKGAVHVVVNRHFVDFVLHDYRSQAFMEWLFGTGHPG